MATPQPLDSTSGVCFLCVPCCCAWASQYRPARSHNWTSLRSAPRTSHWLFFCCWINQPQQMLKPTLQVTTNLSRTESFALAEEVKINKSWLKSGFALCRFSWGVWSLFAFPQLVCLPRPSCWGVGMRGCLLGSRRCFLLSLCSLSGFQENSMEFIQTSGVSGFPSWRYANIYHFHVHVARIKS